MRLFQRQLAGCLKSGVACINWHCTDSQFTNALRAQSDARYTDQPLPNARAAACADQCTFERSASPLACCSDWAAARVLSWSVHLLAFKCKQRPSAQRGGHWTGQILPVKALLLRTGCMWFLATQLQWIGPRSTPVAAACGVMCSCWRQRVQSRVDRP